MSQAKSHTSGLGHAGWRGLKGDPDIHPSRAAPGYSCPQNGKNLPYSWFKPRGEGPVLSHHCSLPIQPGHGHLVKSQEL